MAPEDGQTVDEQFARLSRGRQRELEEKGLGLSELREIALEQGGEAAVRHILAQHSASSNWWDFDGSPGTEDRAVMWPWVRLLLVAVAGVLVCLVSTYSINASALFVGAACGLFVVWAALKTRLSLGSLVTYGLVAAAYIVLIWVGSQSADQWYLQVRGQENTVAYAQPEHSESHGVSISYCRVKLPDGSVRRVHKNDKWCADKDMLGTRREAVIDPAGHYRPVLGSKANIGGGLSAAVCLGAAVVLVAAPVTAGFMGRRNRGRRADGMTA